MNMDIESLIEVKNIFESLEKTNGRNAKEEILSANKMNILFKDILDFVYNPYILTGISSKKINKDLPMLENMTQDITCVMDYIKKNNTGKDNDIAFVRTFIKCMPDELEAFLVGIFTKSLKVGITLKTINKVFGDFIPEYNVMLAEKFEDNRKRVEGKDFTLTMKLDGRRLTFIKDGNLLQGKTRQGLTVEGLVEIENDFQKLPDGVYDGELCAVGTFEDSKAMFKETSKRASVKGDKTGLKFVCFDYIQDPKDFYKGKCDTPYRKRQLSLFEILFEARFKHNVEFIEGLEILYHGNDLNVIPEIMKDVTSKGEEGLMLNISDAPYECKRSKSLLKIKAFNTVDLKVIRYEEGSGRNRGRLGALVVDYKGHEVKVGSGFTDEQRDHLWQNRNHEKNSLIGKIIEIQYFEETQNEQNGLSLRFPTFLRIREDKTEPSYF